MLLKRKEFIISKISAEIRDLVSKYTFVKAVVDEKLIINKRSKTDIEGDICKISNIEKKEDSYDYLLRMPLYSLTKEKLDDLLKNIKSKKDELDGISSKTEKELWLEDLDSLKI